MDASRSEYLCNAAELLQEVFPTGGYSHEYLKWLYEAAPEGREIASDYREEGRFLGHYSVVPQTWATGGQHHLLALSLNTAVREAARGKGLFTRLAEETYLAATAKNAEAIIGVANANSTPGFLRRLGFTLVTPLPVVVGMALPIALTSGRTHRVTEKYLASAEFQVVAEAVDIPQNCGFCQDWGAIKLAWRLASPRTKYALHQDDSGLLVTTTATAAGMPIVIALKFLRRKDAPVVRTGSLLRLAAAHHRSPIYIYAGFNRDAHVAGLPLPRRVLPSPLNLIYRPLSPHMPAGKAFEFGAFEFLDFDAY